MTRNHSNAKSDSNRWAAATATLLILVLIGVAWWMARTPVKLDEQGYDFTIALYQVCNQRSSEGLQQIEDQMREFEASQGSLGESHQVVMTMIATAKSGKWQEAAIACRQALEDQVKR